MSPSSDNIGSFFVQRLRGQTSYFCAHRLDVESRLVRAEGVCGVAL